MLKVNVTNETNRLKSVILGTAVSNGATPTVEEAYDPKSLEHIRRERILLKKIWLPKWRLSKMRSKSTA